MTIHKRENFINCRNCFVRISIAEQLKKARDEAEFELQDLQKMTAYSEGQNNENLAWLKGERCVECGGKKKVNLTSMCHQCLEQCW